MGPLGRPRVEVYAKRLRTARRAAGLSIRAVAAMLHIDSRVYREYERHTALPIDLIGPFCAATKCSPIFLLTGMEDGASEGAGEGPGSSLTPLRSPPPF